jgi:hypothetical protein
MTATIIISPLHSCLALASAACLADRVRGQRSALCGPGGVAISTYKRTWRSAANPPDASSYVGGPDLAKLSKGPTLRYWPPNQRRSVCICGFTTEATSIFLPSLCCRSVAGKCNYQMTSHVHPTFL